MKKLFRLAVMAVLMIVSTAMASAQRVVIDGNNVCIRSSSTVNANNKIGHENRGASFAYIGSYGSFYCINYYGNYGYVHKSFAHVVNQQKSQPATSKFAHITGNNVRIRTAPSLNAGVCGSCNRGEYYIFQGYAGAWVKIKYGGQTRYVHSDFVSIY